jgi:predicted aldo/keto reductase-like oxidoreductase
MQYRRLGRTNLQVSLLGVGGGYLMLLEQELGTRLYQRARELGLNYFDGRYGDSSRKLAPVIKRDRAQCIVASKTAAASADELSLRVEEDLRELDTDYLDIYFLRCYSHEMLAERLAPGGAFEGLRRAREQGKIRFTGLADHGDLSVLVAGIESGLVDVVIFPLNIVRREALERLIPVAQRHDVGLVVMKPLSVGKIPAELGLRWLANQPIHTMAPGTSSLAQLEADAAALEREPLTLSAAEQVEIEDCRARLDRSTCRICDALCQPVCEAKLNLSWMLHHDVMYEHYRNLGLAAFLEYPFAPWSRKGIASHFAKRLASLKSCTRCRHCEEVCPHHLPILEMLDRMLADHPLLLEAVSARGWNPPQLDETRLWFQTSSGGKSNAH